MLPQYPFVKHKTNSQQLYNQFAPFYRRYAEGRVPYLAAVDQLVLDDAGGLGAEPSMVDVGCGDGRRSFSLAKHLRASRVTLVDDSEEMCQRCSKYPTFEILQADIAAASFVCPNEAFTIVTCLWNVLGHVEGEYRRRTAFKHLAQLTSRDGRIYLDVNNRFNLAQYGWGVFWRNLWSEMFSRLKREGSVECKITINDGLVLDSRCHFFSTREVRRLARDAGLVVEKVRYVDYRTGHLRRFFWQGQIFLILGKAS